MGLDLLPRNGVPQDKSNIPIIKDKKSTLRACIELLVTPTNNYGNFKNENLFNHCNITNVRLLNLNKHSSICLTFLRKCGCAESILHTIVSLFQIEVLNSSTKCKRPRTDEWRKIECLRCRQRNETGRFPQTVTIYNSDG